MTPLPPDGRDRQAAVGGIVLLALACLFWASTNLFIKYLSFHCGTVTQNFYRYLFAALLLWGLVLQRYPGQVRPHLRLWRDLLLMTAAVVGFQLLLVTSLYYLQPGFVSLLQNATVIFTALLAYLCLPDERPIIRSARYLLGTLVALGCAVGLVLSAPGRRLGGVSLWALAALAGSAFWAGYTIVIRRLMRTGNPVVSFTLVATLATGVFFAVAAAVEDVTNVSFRPTGWAAAIDGLRAWTASAAADELAGFWLPMSALAVSAWLCLALAHSFYYAALPRVGAAVTGTVLLAQPPLTVLLSLVVYDERISLAQALCGAGILLGAYQTLAARLQRAGRWNGSSSR